MSAELLQGDALERLREMAAESVQTCITSPPYYGLRDYGQEGQIGLESTPDAYVAKLVEVFCEVKRVLRDDGTLWLNMGDSYAGGGGFSDGAPSNEWSKAGQRGARTLKAGGIDPRTAQVKPKDLLGIPWMLAFALRADGWFLRSEIIWAKPNPMPESVTDRPTKAHEQVFLLSKAARYYYDAQAIAEAALYEGDERHLRLDRAQAHRLGGHDDSRRRTGTPVNGRNKRSVWTVATQPYAEAHFATFPPKLIEPMVLAGAPRDGTVLDPFAGSGTTLEVALKHRRSAIGIELNPDYCDLARRRLSGITPSMFDVALVPR